MTRQQLLFKAFEKAINKRLKQIEDDATKVINDGTTHAVKAAIKDVKIIHHQYVRRYYDQYTPKKYMRMWNLWDTITSIQYKDNGKITGNIEITFDSSSLQFDNPKTNADMVFQSFMEGSRYSTPYVMKQDTDHFGDHVVKFAPEGTREILAGTQGGKNYGVYANMSADDGSTLLGRLNESYRRHLRSYVVDYFNSHYEFR